MRGWRNDQGDFVSLVLKHESLGLSQLSDEVALRDISRAIAQSRGGGLIEVGMHTGAVGPTAFLIYKRLLMPAYAFTGMLFVPGLQPSQVWTVVAHEHGITGLREAIITAELFDEGKLRIEDYERTWAKDPYDPGYSAVDRRVLRFVSDDESYDERFPDHPLSKVRRILAALPDSVHVEETGIGTANS